MNKISNVGNTKKSENDKAPRVIKYDMEEDDAIRASALTAYNYAKMFKELGLTFRDVKFAHSDANLRKLFALGPKGVYMCLEISLNNMTDSQKAEAVEEVKSQMAIVPSIMVKGDKSYNIDRVTPVHCFLFRDVKSNS